MPVNDENRLQRTATLGLALSWIALILTLVGGVLTLIGSFDAAIGRTTVLVRYSDAYLPEYVVRLGAVSYFAFAVALWKLILFLRLSRSGQVFMAETTKHLRAFGRWLLVAAAISTLLPLSAVAFHGVASAADASQVPAIRVPLFTSVFVLAIATLVMMICRIIDEGRRLRDDLDEIV